MGGPSGILRRPGAERSGPIAAPFAHISEHVFQAPRVGLLLTHRPRPRRGKFVLLFRPGARPAPAAIPDSAISAIPGDRVEVGCIVAALDFQIACVSRAMRSGAAGVFPLRLGGQAHFPACGQPSGEVLALRQPAAIVRGFCPIDPIHGHSRTIRAQQPLLLAHRQPVKIPKGLLLPAKVMQRVIRQHLPHLRADRRSHDFLPDALCQLRLRRPKTVGQDHLMRRFEFSASFFGLRTTHRETLRAGRRAPMEVHSGDQFGLARVAAAEEHRGLGLGSGGRGQPARGDRPSRPPSKPRRRAGAEKRRPAAPSQSSRCPPERGRGGGAGIASRTRGALTDR